jgi:hypothetical protein
MTKPSLTARSSGRTETRVLASASMPSVTLVTVYSHSSTCVCKQQHIFMVHPWAAHLFGSNYLWNT